MHQKMKRTDPEIFNYSKYPIVLALIYVLLSLLPSPLIPNKLFLLLNSGAQPADLHSTLGYIPETATAKPHLGGQEHIIIRSKHTRGSQAGIFKEAAAAAAAAKPVVDLSVDLALAATKRKYCRYKEGSSTAFLLVGSASNMSEYQLQSFQRHVVESSPGLIVAP